jgi:hypothetical protein
VIVEAAVLGTPISTGTRSIDAGVGAAVGAADDVGTSGLCGGNITPGIAVTVELFIIV